MIRHILFYLSLGAVLGLVFILTLVKVAFGEEVSRKTLYAPRKAIVEAAWTDNQIATAIYYAEGGKHARYPYGIRSRRCAGSTECHQICLTTVKRNRQRFANYGHKNASDFITFLGSRYCPVGASNDKNDLNKNWINNVTWYLNHPKKGII